MVLIFCKQDGKSSSLVLETGFMNALMPEPTLRGTTTRYTPNRQFRPLSAAEE
jgi:hypothetical protein